MPELGVDGEVVLADGVRLRSSGVRLRVPEVRGAGAFAPGAPLGSAPSGAGAVAGLAPVIAAAGMRAVSTVPLDRIEARGVAPHVDMVVPAPAPGEGQVVLEVDDAGLVRWRLATERTFRISFGLGSAIRTVLHLMRFPIESAAAAAGTTVVGWWEERHRPHALHVVTPETRAAVPTSDRPFLLLVHGTFSTIGGGFAGLSRPGIAGPGLAELVARYDGRVLGFDHPTLHVDPSTNADWFLRRLPRDRPVTLDLLTHSRGGLVGRRIADPAAAAAAGVPAPNVRRLIHVGTPNGGTVLASPKRWTTLIDVFSNLVTLLPDEPATATAEAVIELVKQVATGVFEGLAGLTAMDPANPAFVAGGAGSGVERAIASDFTPADGELRLKALNALVDPFFGAGNDLVVPTEGVYSAGGYRVADPFVVPSPSAVAHTAFFADARVRSKIAEWLPGA